MPHFRVFCLLSCLIIFVLPGAAKAVQSQDICIGNNTPGPFLLAWKHITPDSETVQINGLSQRRGLDYSLDADAGTVLFTRALPARSATEITYQYDPATAQRSNTGQAIPLSVDLARSQNTYLSLDALTNPVSDSSATHSGTVTLGVGFGWQGRNNTQIATKVFFAPGNGIAGTAGTGIAFSGGSDMGRDLHLSFGLARASIGMTNVSDNTIQAGQQTLMLASRYAPSSTVQANVKYTRTDPVAQSQTAASSQTTLSLTLNPNQALHMEADLASNAAAMGSTDSIALKAILTPAADIKIDASAARMRQSGMNVDQQGLTLTVTPRQEIRLNTEISARQQNAVSASLTAVGGTVRPLSFLEISGSFKNRTAASTDTNLNDTLDTSMAQVSFIPLKNLRFTGKYAQNPDSGDWSVQHIAQHGVGMETSIGALNVSGGCDWSQSYDAQGTQSTVHADLALRLSPITNVSFGYRNCIDSGSVSQSSEAYTVAFSHSLGSALNLSFSGKRDQQAASNLPSYNASANLGLQF